MLILSNNVAINVNIGRKDITSKANTPVFHFSGFERYAGVFKYSSRIAFLHIQHVSIHNLILNLSHGATQTRNNSFKH